MYMCTCTDNLYVRTAQGRATSQGHRITDGRFKVKDVGNINFFIYYPLDDDTLKHVLQLENYTKEWVLLLLQATV